MKNLLHLAVIVLAVSATALVAADVQPPAAGNASSPAAPAVAGEFTGIWGNDTDGGTLRLSLKQNGAARAAEVSFTFQESEIPCKVTSFNVDGAKMEIVVEWAIEGSPGQSRMIGELSGAKIEGTYQSQTSEGTSKGTWTVTRT
jgi:hypothetical protein